MRKTAKIKTKAIVRVHDYFRQSFEKRSIQIRYEEFSG